ncbi:MAG: 50S ribosomal protein L21e [Candidatus Aenigmatarchaeota archaeon]
MVRKSYGKMRKTRKKLKLSKKPTLTRFLQEFNPGDKVVIDIATCRKIPHPNFQGLTGTVIGKRGRSFEVKIRDKNSIKTLFIRPEHLKLQK